MILYRHNGEAICLTPEEMREIHQEVERANMIEDIQARLEDMELPEAGPSELTLIVGIAERLLPHNEPYFDAYWNTIEDAIDEWRSNHGGNFQNDRSV